MPSPSVVGQITQIGPPGPPQTFVAGPGARYAPVQIQGGPTCRLDLNDPRASVWGDVLRDFAQTQEPVYLLRVRKVMHAEVGGPKHGTSSEERLDPRGPFPVQRSPVRRVQWRLSVRGYSTVPSSANSTATRRG
jgi:hypothetical protein